MSSPRGLFAGGMGAIGRGDAAAGVPKRPGETDLVRDARWGETVRGEAGGDVIGDAGVDIAGGGRGKK